MLRRLLLPLLLLATSLSAAQVTSIEPASGPTSGGTVVTLKGDFWPFTPATVRFGSTPAPEARFVDEHTLVVTTPPHLPGTSSISVFEYDLYAILQIPFTFVGPAPDALERVLLPLFTPPSTGAFGSMFHTDLRVRAVSDTKEVKIFGLSASCDYSCSNAANPADTALPLFYPYQPEVAPFRFTPNGTPGLFVYLTPEDVKYVAMNLRAYDSSRSLENFGTELPIVRDRDFVRNGPVTLIGIPTNLGFRNTLRIYATEGVTVTVTITDDVGTTQRTITLPAGRNVFEPAYASFGDFGVSRGTARVKIEAAGQTNAAIWAFVSVTNNDTQVITTITPFS